MKQVVLFLLASVILTHGSLAQVKSQSKPISPENIKKMAEADGTRLIEVFKDIHQNPEIAFQETRTASIVAAELKNLGFDVVTGVGKTGVVGILKNGAGPTVMWRADMDALGVLETTSLPYASKKVTRKAEGLEIPVMHACGHDAHTTWMLGIAKIMASLKREWKGTLIMVGQPSEEPGGGADAMAAEMYGRHHVPVPNYLLGMHTAPVAVGLYLNLSGDRMAGADQLDVTFYGVGGHGSQPQDSKDPVVMAAQAIIQYQTIISRSMDPQHPAVLTVGAVQAGTDNNIIPSSATLKLNLRWFTERDRQVLLDGIKKVNEGIAIANGLPKDLYPVIQYKQMVTPLKNDKALVDKINRALSKMLGPDKNLLFPPVMGSEDFQHLVKDYPEVAYDYILFGVANPDLVAKANAEGKPFPFTNHNGNFQVDLAAIPLGAAFGAVALVEAFRE